MVKDILKVSLLFTSPRRRCLTQPLASGAETDDRRRTTITDTSRDARFWDRTARKYAASSIGDPEGFDTTLRRTRDHLKPGDAVFEFGCGTGTAALKLAPFVGHILATDISSEMIAIAREKAAEEGVANVHFEVGTPDETRWDAGAYDAAIGYNILHLVHDRPAALAGLHRLLKPGGVLITKTVSLTEMNPAFRVLIPIMQAIGQAPHVTFVSEATLTQEIEAAGFGIIARERHGTRGKDVRPFFVARKS